MTAALGLAPGNLHLLRQALSDAIRYRDPPVHCTQCETLGSLCSQCTDTLSQARAYLALSRELETSAAGPDSPGERPADLTTH
jgi:hypothetical protein